MNRFSLEDANRLIAVGDRAPVMRLVSDTHGRSLHATVRFLAWLGYSGEELAQADLGGLTVPDDREAVAALLERVRRNDVPFFTDEWRMVAKDGRLLWARLDGAAAFDGQGRAARVLIYLQDITAQKAAEEESTRSRLLLSQAERLSHTGAWEWDLKSDTWAFSDEWRAIHGVEQSTLSREQILELAHPDDRDAIFHAFEGVRTGRTRYDLEHRIVRRDDGAVRWVRAQGQYVLDRQGGVSRIYGFAQDITEHKREESALKESEERLRTIFEQAAVGVALVDSRSGRFVRVNQRYCDIVGYSIGEMIDGRTFHGITHPDDRQRGLEAMERLLAGEIREFTLEKRCLRKDGSVVWVNLSVSPVWLPGEQPTCHIAVVEDISERRRLQAALQESEERFREAFAHAPIGMVMNDLEGHFLQVNPAYCDITGYSAEELLRPGFDFVRITHPEDRGRNVEDYRRLLAGEIPAFFVEKRYIRKDGRIVWVRASASLRRDAQGRPLHTVGLVEDIDRRKQMELSLQRMNAELEEFAYITSHDLKTPLRAVATLASIIDEEAGGRLDDENRGRLRLMRERVAAMDGLIEGLLAYARLGGNGGEPEREEVPLTPLLQELLPDLSVPNGFSVELEEPLPTLRANPLQLRQVLQNIVGNAIAHHDRPGEGHVRVRALDGGDHWCLEVADDGPGIPESSREEVFRMFATGAERDHSGIGLAVARKIVTRHGGRVDVTDNHPRGALFRIRWPK